MIKQELQQRIAEILNIPQSQIHLEHPENFSNGDFSCNVALVKAKEVGESPNSLAKKYKELLDGKINKISKIEVAGPGFINLHLSRDFFADSIQEIESNNNFGNNDYLKGKRIMVEYTDPNPFKEFHIGHLMTNTIGESIARLFEKTEAEVKKVCYQGDVGLHVAKAVWALSKNTENNPSGASIAIWNPIDAVALGKAYSEGNVAYETNEKSKNEIIEINRKLYEIDSKKTYATFSVEGWYFRGREISLKYFETIYQKLGTKFDHYFFESETAIFGQKMVEDGLGKDIFKESEGAVIYPGEKHGLHTRVFINKFGIPTYEAKDLGLAKLKYDTFPYDVSVTISANEISEYFKVVKSALSQIEPKLSEKIFHIPHGMMRLPSGKMSSRTGDVITALSLIDEVKGKVLEKMKDRDIKNKDEVAEQIAIGAIKFSILKQSPGKDIVFDFDKSISFEGDSGPYLQYTAVRANSVLEKGDKFSLPKLFGLKKDKKPSEIANIERLLYRLPEIIERACKEYSPQYVVTYLLEVAGAYNAFYGSNQIIGSDYESYYLSITKATKQVLVNGLNVLGIKTPQKM